MPHPTSKLLTNVFVFHLHLRTLKFYFLNSSRFLLCWVRTSTEKMFWEKKKDGIAFLQHWLTDRNSCKARYHSIYSAINSKSSFRAKLERSQIFYEILKHSIDIEQLIEFNRLWCRGKLVNNHLLSISKICY